MTLDVVLVIVGLVLACFAASAETALTTVSRIRVRARAEDGDPRARRVLHLHEDPNGYLSTILAANTIAVIVASTGAALLFQRARTLPEALGTAIFSIVVLVFCEIAPKQVALRFNERVAMAFSLPVEVLTTTIRPLIAALTWFSSLLLRVTTRGRAVRGPFLTEDELKLLVAVTQREGVVEEEERAMITGILEMTDKPAREVMVPRVDVVGIERNRTVAELTRLIVEHGHSRLPVYDETIDNIVGMVYAKDLLHESVRSRTDALVGTLARPAYFVPEAKRVGELLHEMQMRKVHIAVVVDEYGGTAGVVTIEDLIEEIVGPIRDEYDLGEEEEVQFLSEHEVLMSARVSLDDVRDLLHLDVGEVEADSLGGLVYERLGTIPSPGATVTIGEATLTVETVRRQSIGTIRITSPTPFTPEHDGHRDSARENGEPPVSPG